MTGSSTLQWENTCICTATCLATPSAKSHKLGMADYLPSDLSTFSAIRTAVRPNNVFIANTTDMDEEGYLQLPYCQMFEKEQLACADTVIVEINPTSVP